MNANELTALISECLRETDDHEFFLKLESVLRRQQAEIDALKAENERLFASMLTMALDEEVRKVTEQYECNGFCGEYECKENKSKCKRSGVEL